MSCNGCRVLRKGCSETCILRPCLQWMDTPESQGHATLFLAKFFGRAGLMSFISNVPHNQRPALFQSLLYESCGRTVNPVTGAVGLLWTGNWHVCQEAVETVLRGGTLKRIPEFLVGAPSSPTTNSPPKFTNCKVQRAAVEQDNHNRHQQLYLSLTPPPQRRRSAEELRPGTPSLNSEESVTTVSFDNGLGADNRRYQAAAELKLLNLFV